MFAGPTEHVQPIVPECRKQSFAIIANVPVKCFALCNQSCRSTACVFQQISVG